MALPLWMLRNLQIRTGQKIGLTLLFLIATIDIVFDILRTTYNLRGGLIGIETIIWDILEPNIAVIISALPTYRALFRDRPQSPRAYRCIEPASDHSTSQGVLNSYELSDTLVSASDPEPGIVHQSARAQTPVIKTEVKVDASRHYAL